MGYTNLPDTEDKTDLPDIEDKTGTGGNSVVGVVVTTIVVTVVVIGFLWMVFGSNNSPSSSTPTQASSAQLASNDNNPGLLKDSSGNLISYNSPQDGYGALLNYLQAIIYGTSPTGLTSASTLSDFSNVYAPASGNANPSQYATHLASQLGVSIDATMGSLQSNIGKLADAIAENNGYNNLNRATPPAQTSQQLSSGASANLSPSVISQIEPTIVEINCYSADESLESSGSGVSYTNKGINLIESNYHVYAGAIVGGQAPSCYAVFPQAPNFTYNGNYGDYQITLDAYNYNPNIYEDIMDFTLGAPLSTSVPLNSIPTINNVYKNLGMSAGQCPSTLTINVGDALTIFGYPRSGNLLGISETVTEGIVSGIVSGPIYKTNAAIDHGNSGGLAILNKDLCALGIPTLGDSGLTAGIGYIQSYTLANEPIQQ